jgi:3-oxoacyl-[acyl-carrier-protein] synthase II
MVIPGRRLALRRRRVDFNLHSHLHCAKAVLFPFGHSTDRPRVVITGAGIITALGLGWKRNAEGFRAGKTAMRPVTLFDVSRQRVKTAAEVDLPQSLPSTRLSARQIRRMDRATKLLLLSAHEAWQQAGWQPSDDLPLVLGTTSGGMSLGEAYYRQAIQSPGDARKQATRVQHYQSQRQALDVCEALGFRGPITIIANACASGANSIGHAWDILRRGHADRVLTGGYDALSQMVFGGFDSLQALSPTQCRPFDARRDGLALGEGAAMLALETLDSARARNAEILGEIVGYGAATDAHHLTQPHPNGDAAVASMSAACTAANLAPEKIGYINAHGTGTPLNDGAEAAAINRWAGAHAKAIRVSSTKSSVGHLLGGAGSVEAVICLMALRERWLPPTSTLETIEPACEFPVVQKPMDAKLEYALTNSFGFGGANASLILRRWF